MSTAAEIEKALRELPAAEARAVARWLDVYLAHEGNGKTQTRCDAVGKWRGRGRLPAGENVDEYLKLTRDGDGC